MRTSVVREIVNPTRTILAGLCATAGILCAWSFAASFVMTEKIAIILHHFANIKGIEYIVVAAFIGLLPAFFKAFDDDTRKRRAMKL